MSKVSNEWSQLLRAAVFALCIPAFVTGLGWSLYLVFDPPWLSPYFPEETTMGFELGPTLSLTVVPVSTVLAVIAAVAASLQGGIRKRWVWLVVLTASALAGWGVLLTTSRLAFP